MKKSKFCVLVLVITIAICLMLPPIAFFVTLTGHSVLIPQTNYKTCGISCRSTVRGNLKISVQAEMLNPRGRMFICLENARNGTDVISAPDVAINVLIFDVSTNQWLVAKLKSFKAIKQPFGCDGLMKSFVVDTSDNWTRPADAFPENTEFKLLISMKRKSESVETTEISMYARTLRPINLLFGFL